MYGLLTMREVKMDLVLKTRKKKLARPISNHLDRTSLVNNGFIIWDKTPKHDEFPLRDKACIPSGQGSSILPAREAKT